MNAIRYLNVNSAKQLLMFNVLSDSLNTAVPSCKVTLNEL